MMPLPLASRARPAAGGSLLSRLAIAPAVFAPTTPGCSALSLVRHKFAPSRLRYNPSTLKRKRSAGFMARLRSPTGRKILKRRRMKGRMFLTH